MGANMELELKKECLDTYEPGEPQTLTQEETTETIVPDYCPDIARIISAEGTVYLHGGAEQEGLSGTVRVTVYTPRKMRPASGRWNLPCRLPHRGRGYQTVPMSPRKRRLNCWKAGC